MGEGKVELFFQMITLENLFNWFYSFSIGDNGNTVIEMQFLFH